MHGQSRSKNSLMHLQQYDKDHCVYLPEWVVTEKKKPMEM